MSQLKWTLGVVALSALSFPAVSGAATVGNLGGGPPPFSTSASLFAANSASGFTGSPLALAVSFSFAADTQLTTIRVPLRTYNTFPGNVVVELREMSGTTPTGAVLESWTLGSLLTEVTSASASLQTILSVASPVLTGGTQYAVVARPASGVLLQWYSNSTGDTGLVRFEDPTFGWIGTSNSTQLAYEVNGVAPIPLPAASLMGGALLMGLLGRRAGCR